MEIVCLQGLGLVGAAMAIAVASAKDEFDNPKYAVFGVDLPNDSGQYRANSLNHGKFPFSTSDTKLLQSLEQAHQRGNLQATTDPVVYSKASIVVVDVQLDIPYLEDEPQLELAGFQHAIETLGKHIQPDTLVLVETTVPPGTCQKIVVPILHMELAKRGINGDSVHVAHSYERVMPGEDYLASITDYWRVFSGNTSKAADSCERFLENVVNVEKFPMTRLESTLASETAKVMENTYRATNIAFINEWSNYAEAVGIDLFAVVSAIGMRPTHSNIRYPGLGVGGYCLTKDPTFAPAAAKQFFGLELDFPFSRLAVRVNHEMPLNTVNRLIELMGGSINQKKVLICGVSYKQDVGDTRYSPSELLVRSLSEHGAVVTCHDPFIKYWDEMEINLVENVPQSHQFDAVIFAVPHQYYRDFDLLSWAHPRIVILDANNIFSLELRQQGRTNGLKIESIGRGNGL